MLKMLKQFWSMLSVLFLSGEAVAQNLGAAAIALSAMAKDAAENARQDALEEHARDKALLESK